MFVTRVEGRVAFRGMSVRVLLIAGAAALSAVLAAAEDVRPAIGPFALGSTVDEAKRAAPSARWETAADKTTGRLSAISAPSVWSLETLSFRLTLRPNDYGTRLLKFENDSDGTSRDECQRRAIAVVAHLEGLFDEFGPGPSSLGWDFGGATVGAGTLSHIAVTEELGDSYWQAETLSLDKPHYVVVSASFKPSTTRCTIDIAASTELPRTPPWVARGGSPNDVLAAAGQFGTDLADRIEPLFVAEFKDAEAARAVWRRDGRAALSKVAQYVFPTPEPEAFATDAIAAVRARRAAEPSASIEALVAVALNPNGDGVVLGRLGNDGAKGQPAKAPPDVALRKVGDVAVLTIPVFAKKTITQVGEALVQMPQRLVVDLRGNSGGDLETVARVAGPFLQPTAVVVSEVSRSGTSDYITPGPDGARRKAQFVVLIDEETNSGALALAAALVDHTKAKIAGRLAARVEGALTVVQPLPLEKGKPGDRTVRYPIAVFKRPNGALLADGLAVDLAISATGDAAITEAIKAFK